MSYELGLLATVVVGLWLVVDVASASPRRLRTLPIALLGGSVALWALGELIIQHAAAPEQVLAGRRLLYLGTAVLPISWLWCAADAAAARWMRRASWLLLPPAVVELGLYSCLYWDTGGRFVSWTARPAQFGPLFWVHAALGWSLVVLGVGYFVGAATRVGKASLARTAAIVLGATAPVVANVLYLTSGPPVQMDPTPILLGVSVLLLRLGVIDSGLTAFLPVARRDVIEQLRVGVAVADLSGTIVDANPAASEILGERRLVGRSLPGILKRAASDSLRSIEVHEFPVMGPLGRVGSGAVLTDRTSARRIERQLVQGQKLEAIGFLTAGIAHEVNNPLAYVQANLNTLEAMAKELADPIVMRSLPAHASELVAECPEIVAEMRDGVTRIARLVDRLKRFTHSRSTPGEARQVDLTAVARKAQGFVDVGLPHDAIRLRLSGAAPRVLGDEDELVQIVTNLLVNALQASVGHPELEISVRAERGGALLAVLDRGAGIPDDVMPRVFDPFFTTKEPGQGTGLGLSLSLDLAQRHGGTLEASNRSGGGAVFELWLPAAP